MKVRTLAAGQVKIKGLMGQSVICCQLQALFPLNESDWGRKKEEVADPPYRPLMEVGVVSEVTQPGLPYRLSQFIMVSCWQHSHQNFIGRQRFICDKIRDHTKKSVTCVASLNMMPQQWWGFKVKHGLKRDLQWRHWQGSKHRLRNKIPTLRQTWCNLILTEASSNIKFALTFCEAPWISPHENKCIKRWLN